MNAAGGIWAPAAMRAVRIAASRAGKVLRTKLVKPVQTAVEPALARSANPARAARQPIHPVAFLRQQKSRSFHSRAAAAAARFFSTVRSGPARPDNTKFLRTKVGQAVSQFSGRAPFASTLRPNLTGGALPRSAGGYGLGSGRVGGARYFSHGPASQAQILQNVSQAVRAFWISGQKAQFDGVNSRGEARFRAVSAVQDQTMRKLSAASSSSAAAAAQAPGSSLDFRLNPTVTALGPLSAAFPFPSAAAATTFDDAVAAAGPSINTEGFLDVLSGDFARALKDLTATLADLQRLSVLGDLPVQLEKGGHVLRVRFPGVDADTVEALCEDLGLTRGVVREDPGFSSSAGVPVALKFPFASTVMDNNVNAGRSEPVKPARAGPPAAARYRDSDTLTESSEIDDDEVAAMFDGYSEIVQRNPWLASPSSSSDGDAYAEELLEGYESMSPRALAESWPGASTAGQESYEGLEGVYRFLEECDRARDRF